MALQKTQKNALVTTIRGAGFNVTDFAWSHTTRHRGSQETLTHTATRSYFDFIYNKGIWSGVWEPGDERPSAYGDFGDWVNAVRAVRRWLDVLRAEIEAPDLWVEMQRERRALGGPALEEAANTPFSAEERELISAQIQALKEYAADAHELTANQQRELSARLDYVEAAATRLGRIDWWSVLVGALVNLALAAIVPPAAIQAVLVMAAHGLAHLFGDIPPALTQ